MKRKKRRRTKYSVIIESEHFTKNPTFGEDQKGYFIVSAAKVTGGLSMAPRLLVNVNNMEKKWMKSNIVGIFNGGKSEADFVGS